MKQKNVKWILGNIKQRYFYRVNYNAENWDALVAQLMEDPMVGRTLGLFILL